MLDVTNGTIPRMQNHGAGLEEIRRRIVGLDREVPLLGGGRRTYINFDNGATTPPFRETLEAMGAFMEWYSSVHRGTGFKSLLSTDVYESCRAQVGRFVGADPERHTVIFCCNTTHAINKLCRRLRLAPGERVLSTVMEHHSNLLPWRMAGAVETVGLCGLGGTLDLEEMERKLQGGGVRLVTVTGASNVTGTMPPLGRIARLAHAHGAQLMVDAAQLAAHRAIVMGTPGEPDSIDFLAFSAHKIYAPFGLGVLIGPREFFAGGPPTVAGGGTVKLVTDDDIIWAEAPYLEEAGSPNVTGAVALAKALQILESIGMERVAQHERELTGHLLRRLAGIRGIRVYGDRDTAPGTDRVGVVPILAEGYEHALLAAILGYEYGIGVRHGCFCAHPYLLRLLNVSAEQSEANAARVRGGNHHGLPGFVRISLGIYNTTAEIDTLAEALTTIMREGPRGSYRPAAAGQYRPEHFEFDLSGHFTL